MKAGIEIIKYYKVLYYKHPAMHLQYIVLWEIYRCGSNDVLVFHYFIRQYLIISTARAAPVAQMTNAAGAYANSVREDPIIIEESPQPAG